MLDAFGIGLGGFARHAEREQWIRPLWLPLPGAGERGLELVVALPVPAGSYHAVSRIWVGPRDVLEKMAVGCETPSRRAMSVARASPVDSIRSAINST